MPPDTDTSGTGPFTALTLPLWLILGLWALASFHFPLGHDQGTFQWLGWVVREGGAPYADAWEMKGPLVFWIFALGEWVFGHVPWSTRPLELALLAAAARASWRLGTRLGGPAQARTSTLFLLLWYASGGNWETLQPDAWAGLLILLWVDAMFRLDLDATRGREVLVSGAFLTLIFGLKPPLAVVGVLHPLFRILVRRQGPGAAVRDSALTLGTLLLGILLCLGLVFIHGGLAAMAEVYLEFIPSSYAAASVWPTALDYRLGRLVDVLFLNLRFGGAQLVVVGVALSDLARRDREGAFLAAWWLVALACVWLQGKFFLYHFTLLYPPAALLAARGFARLRQRGGAARRVASALLGLSLALSAGLAAIQALQGLRYLTGSLSRERLLLFFDPHANFDMTAQHLVADWVIARARPGDRLLYWGNDALVNYLSRCPTVGRFGTAWHLLNPFDEELRGRARAEFLPEFRRAPPRFVVVVSGDRDGHILPRDSADYLADFPELAEALERDYRPAGRIRTHQLFLREPPLSEASPAPDTPARPPSP